MSKANQFNFHNSITKKLHKDRHCLRKLIAHKEVHRRLQLFIINAEGAFPEEEDFSWATGGVSAWFKKEQDKGIGSLEERIAASLVAERLRSLRIFDAEGECGFFF